jgi:predicted glycosyltransferase
MERSEANGSGNGGGELGGPYAARARIGERVSRVPIDRVRVALYSHDAMGVGHMRRNLLIAETLAAQVGASILLISGARELNAFSVPAGVDCITLPALRKRADGSYRARSLNIPLEELIALRAGMIKAALTAFRPHVLIVDKVPRGVMNELDPSLRSLRARGDVRCVLGLRDVLDDPEAVRREWERAGNEEVIRECYDAVWVYGDPAVYDPAFEYRFGAAVTAKLHYTGYLDPRARLARENGAESLASLGLPSGRLVLCQLGGGQDGYRLAEAFVQAELPPQDSGLIVTGPFMPQAARRRVHERAARQPRMRVLEFVSGTGHLLGQAQRVVAMGGYNSLCEILALEKPALIVPRVRPRCEQLIRAERFRELGFLDVLHPERVTPGALAEWLRRDLDVPAGVRDRVDFQGLRRLPGLLERVLSGPRRNGAGLRAAPAGECRRARPPAAARLSA